MGQDATTKLLVRVRVMFRVAVRFILRPTVTDKTNLRASVLLRVTVQAQNACRYEHVSQYRCRSLVVLDRSLVAMDRSLVALDRTPSWHWTGLPRMYHLTGAAISMGTTM